MKKKDQGSIQKWYFQDTKGGLVGPYNSTQIIEFIQAGKIKVEGQVFNVDLNIWVAAHEVVHEVSPDFLNAETKTAIVSTPAADNATQILKKSTPAASSIINESAGNAASIESIPEPVLVEAPVLTQAKPEQTELDKTSLIQPVLEEKAQEPSYEPKVTLAAKTENTPAPQFTFKSAKQVSEPASSFSGWSAPPKPNVFKEKHVVDLNSDPTGGIDYFALLNHHRKDNANPNKIQTHQTNPVSSAEEESELLEAVDYLLAPLKKNRTLVFTAAASLFIVVGIAGLIKNYTNDSNREIAQIKNEPKKEDAPPPVQTSAPQSIGSGTNPIKKQSKSVSRLNYDKLMEQSRSQNQIGIAPPTPSPTPYVNENNSDSSNYNMPNQMITSSEPEIITEPPTLPPPPGDVQQQGMSPDYQLNGGIQYPPVPGAAPGLLPGGVPGGQPNMNGIDPNQQNTNSIDQQYQDPNNYDPNQVPQQQ